MIPQITATIRRMIRPVGISVPPTFILIRFLYQPPSPLDWGQLMACVFVKTEPIPLESIMTAMEEMKDGSPI